MGQIDNERIMTPVVPFVNPVNAIEEKFNRAAEQLYVRGPGNKSGSGLMFDICPNVVGAVYMVQFGWTGDGWRTFTSVITIHTLIELSIMTVKFSQYASVLEQTANRMERGIPEDVAMAMAQDELQEMQNKWSEDDPDEVKEIECRNPNCLIHRPQVEVEDMPMPQAIKDLLHPELRKLFGM